MTSMIVKAGIAALVALTGLSATVSTAAAGGPEFGIHVQYHDRDRDRHWRPDHRPRGCAPWLAERKADRMGLRRTRVVDVSRRTVSVIGFGRRGPDRVVFANVRGCPLIRR
ncbi:hypothetical protein J2046_003003 [Rhizobium petrolearium]|uniref:hypothetical protein n=1 Tax=Neorhizobium petrolearium TaxID=515361 RepID=UPI001AE47951|nr:hypothetical protein [Neorhizobium petrolearium]MBP1844736.1 hypothetical protein [Neorhizobium petrolearium]